MCVTSSAAIYWSEATCNVSRRPFWGEYVLWQPRIYIARDGYPVPSIILFFPEFTGVPSLICLSTFVFKVMVSFIYPLVNPVGWQVLWEGAILPVLPRWEVSRRQKRESASQEPWPKARRADILEHRRMTIEVPTHHSCSPVCYQYRVIGVLIMPQQCGDTSIHHDLLTLSIREG